MTQKKATGGWHIEFCAQLHEDFVCCICYRAFKDPVQIPCGHQYCNTCWNDWCATQDDILECPVDGTEVEKEKVFFDKAVENRVLSLRVKCKNNCEWTGELRALEEHLKSCPFDYIHCTNEECKLPLQRSFLPTHLSEECPFRVLACVYCTENYIAKDAQVHMANCGSLPIDCTNGCGKRDIKRNKMDIHLETCPLSVLPCPFADVGCQFKSTKNLRTVHEEAAVKDHLFLAMERIKILEEKAFGATELDDNTIEDEKLDPLQEFDKYGRKIIYKENS